MQSAAQIKAKENFKKAIAYRKKYGCTLKEAFAAVYPKKKAAPKKAAKKKVAGYEKTIRKGSLTNVVYSKAAKTKKVIKPKQQKLFGVKKKAAKKPIDLHKDNKSHNVNIKVVSGLPIYKNAVRVYFSNPKYNYSTSVGPNVTEEEAKKYFLGKFFNVGVYPKEILQKPTRIKFFKYLDK